MNYNYTLKMQKNYGNFEYSWLKNPPTTIQRAMDNILTRIQGNRAFCYMDDVITISVSLQKHRTQLSESF